MLWLLVLYPLFTLFSIRNCAPKLWLDQALTLAERVRPPVREKWERTGNTYFLCFKHFFGWLYQVLTRSARLPHSESSAIFPTWGSRAALIATSTRIWTSQSKKPLLSTIRVFRNGGALQTQSSCVSTCIHLYQLWRYWSGEEGCFSLIVTTRFRFFKLLNRGCICSHYASCS